MRRAARAADSWRWLRSLLMALAVNVQRASLGLALADRLDPYWMSD